MHFTNFLRSGLLKPPFRNHFTKVSLSEYQTKNQGWNQNGGGDLADEKWESRSHPPSFYLCRRTVFRHGSFNTNHYGSSPILKNSEKHSRNRKIWKKWIAEICNVLRNRATKSFSHWVQILRGEKELKKRNWEAINSRKWFWRMQQRLFALSEMEKLNETFNAMDPIISFFSIYPVLAMFFNKRVMRGRQGGDSASVLCCLCCFALLSFVVF